jgi:uncharacterized protein YndB with AHSA1/START domain
MPGKTSTIKHKVLIPNSRPLDVFRAFTSSKIHSKVTGSPAKVNARVGAKFTAWDGYITGRNLKLVKGKRIVQEWRTTDWPDEITPPSVLDISLKQNTKGTELTMIHSKIPSKKLARNYDEGWYGAYWDPMKKYFK